MYPEWVIKHKTKGTNISCINGRYYLYEVSSVWNKEKGRAQKVTNRYLGRITEDGFIPSEKTPEYKAQYEELLKKCKEQEKLITNLKKENKKLRTQKEL